MQRQDKIPILTLQKTREKQKSQGNTKNKTNTYQTQTRHPGAPVVRKSVQAEEG